MPQITIQEISSGISSKSFISPLFDPAVELLNQTNTTCGIYAIYHARALFKLPTLFPTPSIPPRIRNSSSYLSNIIPDKEKDIRWFATQVVKASSVGEVFSCDDMEKLCKALGLGAKIHQTHNMGLMQDVIKTNIDKKRMVLVPFWVSAEGSSKCGDPVKASEWERQGKEGGAHWCLLFGYSSDLETALTYHWGAYWRFDIQQLVLSNNDINDWPEQVWHRVTMTAPDGRNYDDYDEGVSDPLTDVNLKAKPLSSQLARKAVVIANPRIEFNFKKQLN